MNRAHAIALALVAQALVGLGCGSEPGAEDEYLGAHVVTPGKADDYYSASAAEYRVRGEVPLELTAAQQADEKIRTEVADLRVAAVGLYLTAYLADKLTGHSDNLDYGGFRAMVRNHPAERTEVRATAGGGYVAAFAFDVAGPRDLLTTIPASEDADWTQGYPFDLAMPADPDMLTSDINTFDPETYAGQLEFVRLYARVMPASPNGYPNFSAFTSDGVYDVALVYGHDYTADRFDLLEAREAFHQLVSWGFVAPVQRFADLSRDSGPFTTSMRVGAADVVVNVYVYHSDMFLDDRSGQHDLVLAELATRDVFIYSGHAGPYYGFYLDPDWGATVDVGELATAPLSSKQQMFVAQGCQTYSQYADMLYANPAKSEANLDVITTVNYSYGTGTMAMLYGLVGTDSTGHHAATDFGALLVDLDAAAGDFPAVLYGVVGIDDNPKLHPYANLAAIGEPCSTSADCGNAAGNICAVGLDGTKQCGAVATAAAGCPEDTQFLPVASGGWITQDGCFAF
ncbi:MAG: hypothetical protein JRI23_10315 [Deltaproteobacteria bacterium]|jgi:hypothetical protein|nr:hypothetical protein [Deltaproteobacteria bacterium]MBW2532062.1 hypothetical protein [Deltaproteobacteria bacterium]